MWFQIQSHGVSKVHPSYGGVAFVITAMLNPSPQNMLNLAVTRTCKNLMLGDLSEVMPKTWKIKLEMQSAHGNTNQESSANEL